MLHEYVSAKTYCLYNGDAKKTICYNSICAIERAAQRAT